MKEVASLYGPCSGDINLVGERLQGLTDGHHPLLGETLEYVFRTGGKRIRPALVLLSGKLGHYHVDRLVTLAASLEVVHTATLVHDDTIDEALSRRGLDTINALWDGKVAILVGDFLFAQSAQLAARLNSVPIMRLLAETVMSMSSAELRQYASIDNPVLDEADYLQRIAGKTASLFGMCCSGAGIVSDQSEAEIEALHDYGTNLGMAFQIVDDVLDFRGAAQTTGKPQGHDLEQGTVTLPAILFLQSQAGSSARASELLAGRNSSVLIESIRESDAPERALKRAGEYAAAARRALERFPQSEALNSLIGLSRQVVERDR